MKKAFIRIMSLCTAIFIFIVGFVPTVINSDETEEVLKVGYLDYSGFIEEQSDGTYCGYGAEYLAKISEYTGYQYEYIYGEWETLLEMLKNKEIDLLCTAQYSKERDLIYDFSNFPIGYTQGLLYGSVDTDIVFEDFEKFNGKTVGMLKGSAMNELFNKYEIAHNFSCNIIEYNSEGELSAALDSGEIDAMYSENLANHKNLTLLAEIGADSFYLMSYNDSKYIEEINYALQEIKSDVDFETNLYHKYYDDSTAETILQFTTQEKEYIESCGTIRVGLQPNRAPFSIYDEESNTFSGICVDVLNEISETSGLKFEYLAVKQGLTTGEIIKSGDFDVICGIERDNFKTNIDIISTNSFIESAIVPVGKPGTALNFSSDISVAIPKSFIALKKQLELNYPNLKIIGYNTNRECLDAVIDGNADVFIQNTHIIGDLIQEPKYDELDILPIEIMTEHTAMALSRSSNPILISVLNKSIDNLSNAMISSSLIKHTFASPYEYTLGDMIYRFRTPFIIITTLIILFLLITFRYAATRQRYAKKLATINTCLEETAKKADSANVAKSQFLAQMSHEIRTPMNAIIGLTEIAKSELGETDKVNEYLCKIEGSSRLLLGIINDILDMSAIDGGKMKIESSPFDFSMMLTNISNIFYQQAKNKQIDFEVRMNGITEEIIIGDELRVNQILMNLLSNAIKFTPSGGAISLIILQASHTRDKIQLRFSVSDNGCGMSDDMMSRLFKPFEQESASTARKHGGSGLGLSITKKLVEMMGGSISVKSKLGMGTVFTVDIPFTIGEGNSLPQTSGFNEIHTLVVDDDVESCEYSGILLDRLGIRYEYATSGEEALEKIGDAEDKGDPFSLCLIDWRMPEMNGVDVTQKIREVFGDDTIVIIVSAYDLTEIETKGKAAGANYFISKPLFQSTLFDAMMKISGGDYIKIDAELEKDKFDFSGKKVIVAEDVVLNMEVAVKLLEMVGISVICAEDGKQAIEIFKKSNINEIDCILMDVNMPVMDGYEATKVIRNLDREDAASIPIYAMTANAFAEDVTAALNAGMNGHIAKPIETHTLYQTLENVFDKK